MNADSYGVRDRYLFCADRESSEYRRVLEITPGRARLLTPSRADRRARWVVSVALAVAYVSLWSWLFGPAIGVLSLWGPAPQLAWALLIVYTALWLAAAFLFFIWWDRRSLPILAEDPADVVDLILLGARSFGTFQDVRARMPSGDEIHLVVDAREPKFWEAVRLLEGKAPVSG